MIELWKDVKGYEGKYQISNLGNVKSLRYKGSYISKNLVPKTNNDGRLWVELWKSGKGKPMLIHRLVGEAFIPNPDNLPQINHKDENPKNNVVWNLEWCTGEYNIQYSARRQLERYTCFGQQPKPRNGKNNKYPINQYDMSGNLVKTWPNARTILLQTGMSDWSISECCRGNRKKAYGFKWRYAI